MQPRHLQMMTQRAAQAHGDLILTESRSRGSTFSLIWNKEDPIR
jgi:hypothetical protein